MTDEEQGTTPQDVERWISAFEAQPGPEMTADEWAVWTARQVSLSRVEQALNMLRI